MASSPVPPPEESPTAAACTPMKSSATSAGGDVKGMASLSKQPSEAEAVVHRSPRRALRRPQTCDLADAQAATAAAEAAAAASGEVRRVSVSSDCTGDVSASAKAAAVASPAGLSLGQGLRQRRLRFRSRADSCSSEAGESECGGGQDQSRVVAPAIRPPPLVTPAGEIAAHCLAALSFFGGLAWVLMRTSIGAELAAFRKGAASSSGASLAAIGLAAAAVFCSVFARGVFVASSCLFAGMKAIENSKRYLELQSTSPFAFEKAKGQVDESMVEYLQTNYDSVHVSVVGLEKVAGAAGGGGGGFETASLAGSMDASVAGRRRSRALSLASSCSSLWQSGASWGRLNTPTAGGSQMPRLRTYQRRNTHSSCKEYVSFASEVPEALGGLESDDSSEGQLAMPPTPPIEQVAVKEVPATGLAVPPAALMTWPMSRQTSYSRKEHASSDTLGSASVLRMEDSARLKEFAYKLTDWNFDMFEVSDATPRPLAYIGFVCLGAYSKLVDFDKHRLLNFLHDVESSYRKVPYHNSLHAASVARAVYSFCAGCGLAFTQEFMEFTLVLAGLVHDIHHPGLTPQFLSKASTTGLSGRWKSVISPPLEEADQELAPKYNDNSPLEHMHCAITFELLRKDSSAFLKKEDVATIRKPLIRAILGTDMAKHAETMTRLAALIDNLKHPDDSAVPWHWPAKPPANADEEGRQVWERLAQEEFVMELFLHAADIGNPTLPFDQWCRWNRLVQREFYAQGDREIQEFGEFISPPAGFDRSAGAPALHNFTKGFMQYLALPLFEQLHELSQIACDSSVCEGVNISGCVETLRANLQRWDTYVPEEIDEDLAGPRPSRGTISSIASEPSASSAGSPQHGGGPQSGSDDGETGRVASGGGSSGAPASPGGRSAGSSSRSPSPSNPAARRRRRLETGGGGEGS